MGNASDGEILGDIRYRHMQVVASRDDEVRATGFVRLNTMPDPRGPVGAVSGWKLHIVKGSPNQGSDELRHVRALCGIRARHGWGLDLFADAECARCSKAYAAMPKASGETP